MQRLIPSIVRRRWLQHRLFIVVPVTLQNRFQSSLLQLLFVLYFFLFFTVSDISVSDGLFQNNKFFIPSVSIFLFISLFDIILLFILHIFIGDQLMFIMYHWLKIILYSIYKVLVIYSQTVFIFDISVFLTDNVSKTAAEWPKISRDIHSLWLVDTTFIK